MSRLTAVPVPAQRGMMAEWGEDQSRNDGFRPLVRNIAFARSETGDKEVARGKKGLVEKPTSS